MSEIDFGFLPLERFGHIVQTSVMPILTRVDGVFKHIGTGFIIHPAGLMVTATHVVKYAQDLGQRRIDGRTGQPNYAYELYALYISDQPPESPEQPHFGGPIPIDAVWADDSLDIALCSLRPLVKSTGETLRYRCLKLRIGLPAVGDKVLAFGYYNSTASEPQESEGAAMRVDYSQQTASTTGELTEIFPVRRDSGLLRWPCFETTARSEHGLSGGPIFHQDGNVCGVVCSKTPSPDGADYYSFYGSLIWPALGIGLTLTLDPARGPESIRLIDLIRRGIVEVEGDLSCIVIEELGEGRCNLNIRT